MTDETVTPPDTHDASPAPSSRSGKRPTITTDSPVDGAPLDPVEMTLADDVPALVERARTAQAEWATTPLPDRVDALCGLKKRILSQAEGIADLLRREVGKPIEEGVLSEVLPNADLVDYWCDNIEELLETEPIELDAISYPGKRGRIQHQARGVVALITPWNYPVSIPLRTLLPALLAGNAVVFKPSESAPRSGALVASLFEGLLPEGVLTIVQGEAELGRALVSSNVDLVVFTGSVATGKAIAVSCAERLIPCSLELGGKDAAIVLDDCKLERTAQGIVWGAFTNAGQNCAAVERVFVEKGIADAFIERVTTIAGELRPEIDTAYMTTRAQKDKVCEQLTQAIDGGAEVLAGGAPDRDDLSFAPTVLKLSKDAVDQAILDDETFGPLLPIVVVDSAEEAVERANDSRYALTTSVWTRDIARGQKLAASLRSGTVTINNHGFTAALPAAPWTGTGDTGYGITNSRHTLHSLTRVRFVLADRNGAARELWWYPYTPALRTIAFAMARLKGGAAGLLGRIGALFTLIAAFPKRLSGG